MKQYDYSITTKELTPPLGQNKYYAKSSFLKLVDINERKSDDMNIDFGETYGKTREEAEMKMRKNVEEWINKNPIK